jgi:hypothetical protein
MMKKANTVLVTLVMLVFGITMVLPMGARAEDGRRAGKDAGVGVATVAANVVYIPAKLLYAGAGGLTGLLAYGLTLGSRETATEIWVPSIGGDYVLTSDMVRGQQKFHFSGVTDPDL